MQRDVSTTTPQLRAALPLRAVLWRWRSCLALLGLLLLPLAIFPQPALLQRVFFKHDVQHYFYPYHLLPARLVAQGQLPLWNPYAFSGIPLLGDGQTALFYPPNWLFFILPGGAALNYDLLIQFSIAGLGFFLYARSLGLWRLPALIGAIAYMFGGFMTARVVHLSILSGAALIPLLFFCVEKVFRTQMLRWFVAAAGAVALQSLAGHPQVPIYTTLALGLYALIRAIERWVTSGQRRWLVALPVQLAGVYILGYGLAAIQLVPWVELARLSPRAAGASFDFVFNGSMYGSEWLLFVFPYLYGSLAPGLFAAQPMNINIAIKTWEHSAYVGILPLALAAIGLLGLVKFPRRATLRRRSGQAADDQFTKAQTSLVVGRWSLVVGRWPADSQRWFSSYYFALLLLLSLVMAAGKYTPLAGLLYATPVIGKLREIDRAIVLGAFALTVLAAIGMQRLIEAPAAPLNRMARISLLLVAVATALVPLCIILFARHPGMQSALKLTQLEVGNLDLSRPNAAVPLALSLASAILLAWWSRRPPSARTQALAVGLVLLDMIAYAAVFNPTTEPQLYQRGPDVLAAFQADNTPFRKATFLTNNDQENRTAQETLAVSWGMVYGIEDINGFNSLQPRRYTDYLFGPKVEDVSYGYLMSERLLRSDSPILSSLNVKYLLVRVGREPHSIGRTFRQVYANDRVRVYENTQVYPRAYFVDTVRAESDPSVVLSTVTAAGFDGRREALIEAAEPPTLRPASVAAVPARVSIVDHTPNRIALVTSIAEPRFLVLSEMYFPGWYAYVDGVETPIYRANYLFRGVVVPSGQHTLVFAYRPTSVFLGAAISLLALALAAGLVIVGRRYDY